MRFFVQGSGFGVRGSRSGVRGLGFGVRSPRFGVGGVKGVRAMVEYVGFWLVLFVVSTVVLWLAFLYAMAQREKREKRGGKW